MLLKVHPAMKDTNTPILFTTTECRSENTFYSVYGLINQEQQRELCYCLYYQLRMQSLLTRIFYRNTPNHPGEAYNPFAAYRADIENKRSRLFPDRKRVPGRKTKYVLAFVYLVHIYAVSKLMQQKRIYHNKDQQQRNIQRKVAPFLQSVEDIQYTTLKHRQDLIMLEAFKNIGGAEYLQKFNRFNYEGFFQPSFTGGVHTDWQKGGTGRYAVSVRESYRNRYMTGYNTQNI